MTNYRFDLEAHVDPDDPGIILYGGFRILPEPREVPVSVVAEDPEAAVLKALELLGPAGFGKWVFETCAIKELDS